MARAHCPSMPEIPHCLPPRPIIAAVDLADVDERLREWSRWCRASSFHRRHAESIEGNYRSPQRNHWEQVPTAPQPLPIAHRAYATERAIIATGDPYRLVIVLCYLVRASEGQMRRRLKRWQVRDPKPVIAEAVRRVGDKLER